MKQKKPTWKHKINGRSKNLLTVCIVGNVDAVQAVTYRGAKLDTFKKKKYWRFFKKFPFFVRKEIGLYTTIIKPKNYEK